MFGAEDDSFVCILKVQTQKGGADCGLFAVANMTALAHGIDPLPVHYDQSKIITCFEKGQITLFPTL